MRKRARNHRVQGNLRNAWLDELNSKEVSYNWHGSLRPVGPNQQYPEHKWFRYSEPKTSRQNKKMAKYEWFNEDVFQGYFDPQHLSSDLTFTWHTLSSTPRWRRIYRLVIKQYGSKQEADKHFKEWCPW